MVTVYSLLQCRTRPKRIATLSALVPHSSVYPNITLSYDLVMTGIFLTISNKFMGWESNPTRLPLRVVFPLTLSFTLVCHYRITATWLGFVARIAPNSTPPSPSVVAPVIRAITPVMDDSAYHPKSSHLYLPNVPGVTSGKGLVIRTNEPYRLGDASA